MNDKPEKKLSYKSKSYYWEEARLRSIGQRGKVKVAGLKVGKLVQQFWVKKVAPLQKKFGQLAQAWEELLPDELRRHSCLDTFQRGVLRVLVDSDAHYYELNLIIREGLVDRVRALCPRLSIREIRLVRGTWYQRDEEGNLTVSLYRDK